jgi:multicomponent Na+:H+ antiporter subunit D
MKGGLFLAAGLIATADGARTVSEYEGLAERLPASSGAFGVLAFAMVGIPPAVGFVGKWYIALGAIEAQTWPLAVVILASTLLTLGYFARLIERMYFRESADPAADADAGGLESRVGIVTDGAGGPAVSPGMRLTVLAAAVLAVALGAAATGYGQLLEPTVETLLS